MFTCLWFDVTLQSDARKYDILSVATVKTVATAASRKCDEYYETYSERINEMTMEKIKVILGSEFFNKYVTEEIEPFQ